MALQPVELKILGQKVNLKTEGDPEVVREVMALAQERLTAAESNAKGAAPHQIAILALLDITEAYVQARGHFVDQKRTFNIKSSELLNLIKSEITQ